MPAWTDPPPTPTLGEDEVHVWRAVLDRPGELGRLCATLSPDERERGARFRATRDRDRYVAARGLLRTILGRYLSRDPAALRFRYGAHGKPALAGESDRDRLRFNVSHAGGLALYAVARGREVGVDLERVRPEIDVEAVGALALSPRERDALAAVPPPRRRAALVAVWVHKEAYAKAVGAGLSAMDRCEVVFAAAGDPILLEGDPPTPSRWTLRRLVPAPGYAAAVAVEGAGWRLAGWRWPTDGAPSSA